MTISGLLMAAALIWGNFQLTLAKPGGEYFFVDWFSARSLFIDGINPYSETARENLADFARNEAQIELKEGARFDVPLYAAFITLPFSVIDDYPLARAAWMTVLEIMVVALVLMSLSLARWKIKPLYLGLLILFALFWFHGLYPVMTGSMVLIVALVVTGVFWAVRERQYEMAGVFLGLATIQPHATTLFIIFIIYWSLRYKKFKIAGWFIATVLLLSAMAALIRPEWFLDYLRMIIQPETNMQSINQVFKSFLPAAGGRIGLILMWITGTVLFIEWFLSKKAEFDGFYWTGLLTLTLTPWIGLATNPVLYIVSFPAIIYVMFLWSDRWHRVSVPLITAVIFLLFGGLWLIYLTHADEPLTNISGLYFAQPLFVSIMLYWVRWWAIKKPNVWFDQISKG